MMKNNVSEYDLSYDEKVKMLVEKLHEIIIEHENFKLIDKNFLKKVEDIKLGLEFQIKYECFKRRRKK